MASPPPVAGPLPGRPAGPFPARRPGPSGLPARARLWRVLAVAALTAGAVGVWRLTDDAAAPPPPLAGTSGFPVETPATARVDLSLPAPEQRAPTVGGARNLVEAAPTRPFPADALPQPPELPEPTRPDTFIRFIIQRGDTIYDVSIVYGVSIEEILRYNPALGDGSDVDVGQRVLVPVYEP